MNELQMNAAKENLSSWLANPHELGKVPAKIECTGTFELYEMTYYIFRYKKNVLGKWLLGISGGFEGQELEPCGHTFSEMEEYDEATAPEKSKAMVEMIRAYWMEQAEKAEAEEKGSFEQDPDSDALRPGGPFMVQLLFCNPVTIPAKETMLNVLFKHCGTVENFSYSNEMAGFAAKEHIAEFEDGKVPVQLLVTECIEFESNKIDAFTRSQMWDCKDSDKVLNECTYQVVGTDMLAGALPAIERAELDLNFLDALLELYPECKAVYIQSCGKLFMADDIRQSEITGLDRFIKFCVNARFFNIEETDDMIVDTVGMSTLFLPDIQYHFHGIEPNDVVFHAYNLASYILNNNCPIQSGETVDGIRDGKITREIQWVCQFEDALIQPFRGVLDICMGEYAAGSRDG